jgi:hypothetical protein
MEQHPSSGTNSGSGDQYIPTIYQTVRYGVHKAAPMGCFLRH